MDTPTAMLMATTYGVATLGKRTGVAGAVLCAVGALVPDLDVVVRGDTTDFVTWHRGPTHSLLFLALFTPVMAGAARLLGSKKPFRWLCAAAALGLGVGIGSDVITWWGTVVFWPFSNLRVGTGIVFIIDLWHAAILAAPLLAWGVQRLRGRPFPWTAFRVSMIASVAWLVLCTGGHLVAKSRGAELAPERGGHLLDVLPQPLSPFRWAVVLETRGDRQWLFVDHLRPGDVIEERTFPRAAYAGAVRVTDASDEGRLMRWFHRVSHVETKPAAGGAIEVVYRDLAYEMRLPGRDGSPRTPPFRYRFVVKDDRVTEQGWIEEPE